jgi:hypothetical protein
VTTTQTTPESTAAEGTTDSVIAVLEEWAQILDEPAAHNALQCFVDLKVGTTDFSSADDAVREQLLAGRQVRLSRLFPYDPLTTTAMRSIGVIHDAGEQIRRAHGLRTTYVAIGFISWSDPLAARRPNAPILLRPLTISPADGSASDFFLQVATAAIVNPLLPEMLENGLGVAVAPQDLLDASGRLHYPTVAQRLKQAAPGHLVSGLSFDHRAVAGVFSPARPTMARDLRESLRLARTHPLMPSLGALWRGEAVPGTDLPASSRSHDDSGTSPLPLDAEQEAARRAIAAGGTGAVLCPPGTGATQLATAAVVDAVSRGDRVLVTAGTEQESRDLLDRLAGVGLRHLALSLPDAGDSTAAVAKQVRAAIEPVREIIARSEAPASAGTATGGDDVPSSGGVLDTGAATDVDRAAAELDRHVHDLHDTVHPWELSPYQAWLHLANAPEAADRRRLIDVEVAARGEDHIAMLSTELAEYVRLGGLDAHHEASVWDGAAVADEESARDLLARLHALQAGALDLTRSSVVRAAAEVGQPAPQTPQEARELGALLTDVAEAVERFGPGVWQEPLERLAVATGDRAFRAAHPEDALGLMERRRLRGEAEALSTYPSARGRADLHGALVRAQRTREAWLASCHDGRLPRLGEHAEPASAHAEAVAETLADLADLGSGFDLRRERFDHVGQRISALLEEGSDLLAVPRRRLLGESLREAGLGRLLADLTQRWSGVSGPMSREERAAAAVTTLQLQRAAAVSDAVLAHSGDVPAFDRERHEKAVREFQAGMRRKHLEAADRVRRAHAQALLAVLKRTAADPRRSAEVTHVRDLMVRDPEQLLATVPVVVCAPAAVPAVLPAREIFDVAVVLDAGRLSLVEAAPAMLRSRRVVALGDGHLLPPPADVLGGLGVRRVLDEPATVSTDTTPSVLDAVSAIGPVHRLANQHRCLDHRVLPLSDAIDRQHHLPSPMTASPLTFRHVHQDSARGQEDSVVAEVDGVVELVMGHASARPAESLAVLAFTTEHARAIRRAVRERARREVGLAAFFDPSRVEPFVVVEAATSHGLVRDAVILSTGFGRSSDGRVLYRFGALNQRWGAHLMNLATTRARRRLTVTSALLAEDLDLRRLSGDGGKLLRGLLTLARDGGAEELPSRPDDLELAIRAQLVTAGLPLADGRGRGTGRIPLALHHPRRPERLVLAVLTDGPGYRDEGPAPVRDRQTELELRRRGWLTHRVYAPEWFADPAGAVDAILRSLDEAVAWADAVDAANHGPVVAVEGRDDDAGRPHEEGPQAGAAADAAAMETPVLRFSGGSLADADQRELAEVAAWVDAVHPGQPAEAAAAEQVRRALPFPGDDRSGAALRAVRAARSLAAADR